MASGQDLLEAPALPPIQSCAAGRDLMGKAIPILHARAPVVFGMAFRGWWHRLPPRVCAPARAPLRQHDQQGAEAGHPGAAGGRRRAWPWGDRRPPADSDCYRCGRASGPGANLGRLHGPNGSLQVGACWWSRRIRVAALTALAGRGCEGMPPLTRNRQPHQQSLGHAPGGWGIRRPACQL